MYIRQLRVALQGKTGDALKTEEVTSPKRENFYQSEPSLSIILFSLCRTRSKWWRSRSPTTSTCSSRSVGHRSHKSRLVQCKMVPQQFIFFFFYPSTRISSTTRHPSRAPSPSPGNPSRSPRPSSRKSCEPLGSFFLCVSSSFLSSLSSPLLGAGQSARLPIPSCLPQAPKNSSHPNLGGVPSRSTTLPAASTVPPSELSTTVRHSFQCFFPFSFFL